MSVSVDIVMNIAPVFKESMAWKGRDMCKQVTLILCVNITRKVQNTMET